MTRNKPHKPALRALYQWHRYLGLGVALLAVMLALTGMLLNHTGQLELDRRMVRQNWLLAWYGIEQANGRFFNLDGNWLSQWGENLYLGTNSLPYSLSGELCGAVALSDMLVLAEHDSLVLLTPTGRLIDRLDRLDGVPEGIGAIAHAGNERILLKAGEKTVVGDLASGRWEQSTPPSTWPGEQAAPRVVIQAIIEQRPGAELPLERVILDLHSGRLFGAWGSYIMDGAAVVLLFNIASGILIWWKRGRNQRQRRKACEGVR